MKKNRTEELLKENMGAAAHLIHGSSDGRFTVTYAVKEISKEEIESVYFQAVDYDEAVRRYDVSRLKEGGESDGGRRRDLFCP